MTHSDMLTRKELIEMQSLDGAIRVFLRRWAPSPPEDERCSWDFEADFMHIIRRIYAEAQAPYVKAMAEAVARQPMPPFVFDNKRPGSP